VHFIPPKPIYISLIGIRTPVDEFIQKVSTITQHGPPSPHHEAEAEAEGEEEEARLEAVTGKCLLFVLIRQGLSFRGEPSAVSP